MKLVPFKAQKKPLNMLLVGTQGAGKTTACASLLYQPTMLLYSRALESHSPVYMAKGVDLFSGASADNLLPVSFDLVQETDKEIIPWANKLAVGTSLNGDQAMDKIKHYLSVAASCGIKNVVLDSLTAVAAVIKGTARWVADTTSSNGAHNGFAEADAYVAQFQDLLSTLTKLHESGIATVCLCGAKTVEVDQTTKISTVISPELPSYRVAERLVFYFGDIAIIVRDPDGPFGSMLDFEILAEKVSKEADGKRIKKALNITPRLQNAPLGAKITQLPPNLSKIDENVAIAIKLAAQDE